MIFFRKSAAYFRCGMVVVFFFLNIRAFVEVVVSFCSGVFLPYKNDL